MTAIISALDNYTPTQSGENGYIEYTWSNNIRESILQFSFQVTRTNEYGVRELEFKLTEFLNKLKNLVVSSSILERQFAKELLSILYRMIGHTRDIIDGKGECTLTYMMIHTWHKFFPQLACFALKCLVDLGDKNTHQYGSWKDIKYFCDYCKNQGESLLHPLIQYSVQLINEQLKKDILPETPNVSLLVKWVPREKSKFGWLYETLACNYFKEIMETADTYDRKRKAILKCKTQYRKILSWLNEYIDTLQIKQCNKTWSQIDFNKVTSISLLKQKKAFLNTTKEGTVRFSDDQDRIICAENFRNHIKQSISDKVEIKGKRIGMADFVKQAYNIFLQDEQEYERDLLNSQWRDSSTQTGALGKMIAMVDVSGSMEGDPMNVAIALGIRISEKSTLGNRIMTFSSTPKWVNLDNCSDFVSKVDVIKSAPWGYSTNFKEALLLILDSIVLNKIAPKDVEDMILVVLSDMQMDEADSCNKKVLYEDIKEKYAKAGIRAHGEAYKPPHILFWNLRSTTGFPCLSSQLNCSMMSGFSPALLNLFCEHGLDALQSFTPWSVLEKTLENDRYKILGNRLEEEIEI